MTTEPIVLSVLFQAIPGGGEALGNHLRSLVGPTRSEPGCLQYDVNYDPEDPLRFVLYEKFTGQAALDAHIASPHFQSFLAVRASGKDPVSHQVVARLAPLV